jgi:predicted dehydrogenase
MTESKISLGIVGAGFGQQVQVPAFRLSPQCEVVAICASRRERAEQAARTLGIPQATDDWRDLVTAPDIQALALAVPPSLQAEIALAAARAGKHLFCEKPLALNAGQAREILAAARHSEIVHAMDFIYPELASWRKARELRHVALTWRVENYTYRNRVQSWRTASASGGGTLNNFASHTFYYLEWLFGPIARLCARFGPPRAEVEARVDAWLEFAGGFTGTIAVAADAFLGSGHRLEVYGEDFTLVLENSGADYARGFQVLIGTRAAPQLAPVATEDDAAQADGRVFPVSRIAGRFLQAIPARAAVRPNIEDGLRVQQLLDAVQLAQQSGSWQAIGPE